MEGSWVRNVTFVWLYMCFICITTTFGIDDKLDFGHDRSDPSFIKSRTHHSNQFLPIRYKASNSKQKTINNTLGIVCESGGCNITDSGDDSNKKEDADIIVIVETKVNLNQNKSKEVISETPDVPVVVGYRGTQQDQMRNNGPPMPNYMPVYASKVTPVNMHTFNPSFMPTFSPGYNQYTSHRASTSVPDFHANYPPSRPISSGSNRDYYNSVGNRDYYNGPIQANIHRTIQPYENRKSVPAVSVYRNAESNFVDDYENKHIGGVLVPYFEPLYHSHHYGENPPPYIHYPKKSYSYNPVEFKTITPLWSPSFIHKSIPHPKPTITSNNEVKCSCQNEHNQPATWYPSSHKNNFDTARVPLIDDKIAPFK